MAEQDPFDENYAAAYDSASRRVITVGWHVPVYVSEQIHNEVLDCVKLVPMEIWDRRLFEVLRGYVLHPCFTSRLTNIWHTKTSLRRRSFLIDEAICCAYVGNYTSCASIALSAIEGSLRDIYDAKRVDKNLFERMRTEDFSCLPARGSVYGKHLANFLSDRLFSRSTCDDFDGLNRHNIAHSSLFGRPITERDAIRTLLACELLAEFERCRSGEDHSLFPSAETEEQFILSLHRYDRLFLFMAMERAFIRGLSIDHQRAESCEEDPFGKFPNDLRRFPMFAYASLPGVEEARKLNPFMRKKS